LCTAATLENYSQGGSTFKHWFARSLSLPRRTIWSEDQLGVDLSALTTVSGLQNIP